MKLPPLAQFARPARPDVAAAPDRPWAATHAAPHAGLGNRIVQRLGERRATPGLGNRATIQARSLTLGPRGDVHELEADRVAQQVVDGDPLTAEPGSAPPQIQRRTGEPTGTRELDPGFHDQLADSRGAPLDHATRDFMESRFGHDFSAVRIHDDDAAHMLSRRVAAQAFTHGRDIYMGAGRHAPDTRAGRELLAHELTHVIQQGGGESSVLQRNEDTAATTINATHATTTTTATTTAPTTTTTTAIATNPQVRVRGRDLLQRLHDCLKPYGKVVGPIHLSEVRATLRGLMGSAYEVGDPRFLDLIRTCEADVAAIFAQGPLPLSTLASPAELAQVTAYAKHQKHEGRALDRTSEARAIHRTITEAKPKPWRMLGSKLDRSLAVRTAERQVARGVDHKASFLAAQDYRKLGNPIISLGQDAARAVVGAHTAANDRFAAICDEYGMSRLGGFATVFITVSWKHLAADLIRHYTRVSGLDWHVAADPHN